MALDEPSTTTTGTATQTEDDVILEVRDASVTFDMDRGESRVLDEVSMDLRRGEVLGVVGESGSGKSMFADSILDAIIDPGQLSGEIIYHPDDGEPFNVLELSDEELKALRWEEISMVFQGALSAFNPSIKLREHFHETLEAHDTDIEEGMERAYELLEDLYLEPDRVLDSYPHELSGGMKQRTLIALSLVLEPNVLVLDEPTAALDLLMQRSIISLLDDLQEKYNLTMVFISHDLPLVAHLADRLAVLYAFEFVEVGDTDDILRYAAHPYTRALLNSTPNLAAPLEEMRPIEGSAPDPVAVPEGCSYHPRCPLADEQCRQQDPAFRPTEDGEFDWDDGAGPGGMPDPDAHEVACHHWQQAEEAIPFVGEEVFEE
jgi:oligopeptide/dipeptide ABC transporter ATP-binding protein